MGSSVAHEIKEGKVAVDERQLYMANITNSVLVTNKLVVRELLPSQDCHNHGIVLGRSMQQRHETDINELLAVNSKKTDVLASVLLVALGKKDEKPGETGLPEQEGLDEEAKKKLLSQKKQEKVLAKTTGLVQNMRARKYERQI
jgi:hypothetical protein